MSKSSNPLTRYLYLANHNSLHASYRIGLGVFALYQGVTRVIFDTVGLPVGVIDSYQYGILQAITALLLIVTAFSYRFSKLGVAAVAMVAGVYLMLGIDIWLKGAIVSGGGAVLLSLMLLFFELFISEEY